MKFSIVSGIAVIGTLALGACTPPPGEIDIRELCNRRTLTQAELAYLQSRPDFAEILILISDNCPELLAPGAINGGNGGGNGERRPPNGPPPGPPNGPTEPPRPR